MNRRASRLALVVACVAAASASAEAPEPLPLAPARAWTNEFSNERPYVGDTFGAATGDAAGGVYVACESSYYEGASTSVAEYTVFKYGPAGDVLWKATHRVADAFRARPFAIALDGLGNVIVGGKTSVDGFGYDTLTVKLDPNGAELWSRVVPEGNEPVTAVGADGSVAVAMYDASVSKWRTVRYLASGGVAFSKTFGADFFLGDRPNSIDTDAAGNVFVGGRGDDGTLLGYTAGGSLAWELHRTAGFGAVRADGAGGCYAGTFDGSLVAVDVNGGVRWERTGLGANPNKIVLDSRGRVVVVGYGATSHVQTLVFDSAGNPVWARGWNGPLVGGERIGGVALDASDGIHVAVASTQDRSGNTSGIVSYLQTALSYDADGALTRVASVDGAYTMPPRYCGIAVDAAGRVALAGEGPYSKKPFTNGTVRTTAFAAAPVPSPGGSAKLGRAFTFKTTKPGRSHAVTVKVKNRHATEPLVLRIAALTAPFGGGGGTYVVEATTTRLVTFEFGPEVGMTGKFTTTVGFETSDPALPSGTIELKAKAK